MTIAASALVASTFPLSFALFGLTGSDLVQAAQNGAQNLGDLLSQRSPGARTAAQLTKTKKAQHALAKLRQAAPPSTPIAPSPLLALIAPPAQLPVDLGKPMALLQVGSPPPFETIVGPPGGIIGSPPGGGGSPPGGGGSSPPGGGPPVVTTQPLVPAAVPEPGTWATMLLGFGLLGWRFRRERETKLAAARS